MSPAAGVPAVFVDRDGTLIDELGYLTDPDGVLLFEGAAAALAEINRRGLPVVLFTNQSGVARGLLDEPRLAEIHARLEELLAEEGAHLDLILYCPHHPELGSPRYRRVCDCRKPAPGMLLEAQRRLGIDLARSWVVGDSRRDLEAGERAGVKRLVLVGTGKGEEERRLPGDDGRRYFFARDLRTAARRILADVG